MNKKTITIGIPAYNEEANITLLLQDIFAQKTQDFTVEKIIVNSDGSTDKTVKLCKAIKNEKIVVLDNKERKGLAMGQNQLIQTINSDILVLLNADTRITDRLFLDKLIRPILLGKADLTSPSVKEAQPTSFFEKILYISTKIKNEAFERFNQGNNVYTCRGSARAFSRNLYKKIHFLMSVGEDAFSYFYCVTNGFNYSFVKDTKIIFKLPGNFDDHKNQSLRFFESQQLLKKQFGEKFVTQSYKLPKSILLASLFKTFFTKPLLTLLYIIVLFYLKFSSIIKKSPKDTKDNWDMVKSSKKISI